VQHANDGYSGRGNFGSFPSGNMVLIYSPDGTNVYRPRGAEFDGDKVGVGG